MKKKRFLSLPLFQVELLEAKPNKMFQEWQRRITQFMRYTSAVKCAHCGKRSRHHWTQLRFFRVADPAQFTLVASKTIYPPLTPVCLNHILQPEEK